MEHNGKIITKGLISKDINRNYPRDENEMTSSTLNNNIIQYVNNADWIVDCHEAHGYYLLNNTPFQTRYSMGSTITHGKSLESKIMTLKCIDALNKTITKKKSVKKFVTFPDEKLPRTLRYYCNLKNKHYLLTETTGQNEIQPLQVRVNQHQIVILTTLRELGVIKK